MEKELRKIWVTQYWTTKGIIVIDNVEVKYPSDSKRMACLSLEQSKSDWHQIYFHGDEFHFSEEDAVAHVKALRDKKIQSLHKQIAKLEKANLRKIKEGL